MMETILRKVKCSERLPKKEGFYFYGEKDTESDCFYSVTNGWINRHTFNELNGYVEYWYEKTDLSELDSEKILHVEERLDIDTIIETWHLYKVYKALESAEIKAKILQKENDDLKTQLGEGLTKNFFRKEIFRLNNENDLLQQENNKLKEQINSDLRYNKVLESIGITDISIEDNLMYSTKQIIEALKIAAYGEY